MIKRRTSFLFLLSLLTPGFLYANPEQQRLFRQAFKVLETHCFACHGEEKQKGDLRLDSLKAILTGGEGGAAMVQGHADQSLMISAINLPINDEDVMPPRKKDRLTDQEKILLTEWVNQGAPWFGAGEIENRKRPGRCRACQSEYLDPDSGRKLEKEYRTDLSHALHQLSRTE